MTVEDYSPDELAIMHTVAGELFAAPTRMLMHVQAGIDDGRGPDKYGPWRIDEDKRNFRREFGQEMRDGVNYAAAEVLRCEHNCERTERARQAMRLAAEAWELMGGEV